MVDSAPPPPQQQLDVGVEEVNDDNAQQQAQHAEEREISNENVDIIGWQEFNFMVRVLCTMVVMLIMSSAYNFLIFVLATVDVSLTSSCSTTRMYAVIPIVITSGLVAVIDSLTAIRLRVVE